MSFYERLAGPNATGQRTATRKAGTSVAMAARKHNTANAVRSLYGRKDLSGWMQLPALGRWRKMHRK